MRFVGRFGLWIVELLVSIDQLAHLFIFGPWYWFKGGEKPLADETISSKVGRRAIKGYKWALIAEKVINTPFAWFGEEDHCRKRIEWEDIRKHYDNH